MLIIKEPIKLNCKEPIHTVNEGFCHRITDNYHLMTTDIDEEELLHMVTSPPEVYVAESTGTQIMNQNIIFHQKEMKIEMINNLLNRLSMRQEVHLNYQDRIYIDNVLRKLGIKNTSHFIEQVNKQKIRNQSQEEIIQTYWNVMESYSSSEEKIEDIRNTLNQRLEEQKEEYKNYLHESIMNRLQTGVIYRILENFSQSATYNSQWMEQSKIQLAEQKKISHQILINQLENYISEKQVPFIYLEKNKYEVLEGIEQAGDEAVNQQITQAVLLQLLNNIHMERLTGYKKEEQLWINFRNSLYQSAENTIYRIKNQVHQMVENHLRNSSTEITKQISERNSVREGDTLFHREVIKQDQDRNEISENQYLEHYYENKDEKNIYHIPVEIEHKHMERWEADNSVVNIQQELHGKEVRKESLQEEPGMKQKPEKEETALVHPQRQEDGLREDKVNPPERKDGDDKKELPKELNYELVRQLQEINEKSIENWEINNHSLEKHERYPDHLFYNILENQNKSAEEFYEFENVNIQYKSEGETLKEGQTDSESEGNKAKGQEAYNQKEIEKQLFRQLEEINKKNIENLETYKNIINENNKNTTVIAKTMEEKRTESLKALQAPEKLLLEYKKEAAIQSEQQEQVKTRLLDKLPEETRRVLELIEEYRKAEGNNEIAGVTKNDFSTLQKDTRLMLNHLEHVQETGEEFTLHDHEETTKLVERWKYQQQNMPSTKEIYDRKHEVSMVHKLVNQSIEEEVLQQLLEENRALVQKETRNESVQKEQVKVTTIENREEKRILQNNMKDITEMIDQGVKRQIGTISDQVYHRLEKKLSNEKKRRGF